MSQYCWGAQLRTLHQLSLNPETFSQLSTSQTFSAGLSSAVALARDRVRFRFEEGRFPA